MLKQTCWCSDLVCYLSASKLLFRTFCASLYPVQYSHKCQLTVVYNDCLLLRDVVPARCLLVLGVRTVLQLSIIWSGDLCAFICNWHKMSIILCIYNPGYSSMNFVFSAVESLVFVFTCVFFSAVCHFIMWNLSVQYVCNRSICITVCLSNYQSWLFCEKRLTSDLKTAAAAIHCMKHWGGFLLR